MNPSEKLIGFISALALLVILAIAIASQTGCINIPKGAIQVDVQAVSNHVTTLVD